jgi:hypothetical protein
VAVQLLITDEDLVVQGDPLTGWRGLSSTRTRNEPSAGSVTLTAWPEVMAQLQPGHRLVVIRDGTIWSAGPMEIPTDWAWSAADSDSVDPGRVTVQFADDLARVAGYITWPSVSAAWTAQPATGWWRAAGVSAEAAIRQLVNTNCGPGARTERRIPRLALDALAGIGATTTVSSRFEPLLDACRRVALAGGDIEFRVRQVGEQLLFGCRAPVDRTGTARFSRGLGNLRQVAFKRSAPTVTHALVAGTEEEGATTRAYVQVADTAAAASWYRVERFVSGSQATDADGELTDAGRVALADGAAPVELSTVTIDTPDLRAGVDFDLGDRVSVELPGGIEVAELVRSMELRAEPDTGETVTAVVGSPDATRGPDQVAVINNLSRRLGNLEAR